MTTVASEKLDTLQAHKVFSAIADCFKDPVSTKDSNVRSSIKEIFQEAANVLASLASIANEISKMADKVTPEEFNLVLAASVQPLIQVNVLVNCISQVGQTPPPPPPPLTKGE